MSARILIIEDKQANLDLMTYLLEAFGYAAGTAMDGAEGLESVRRDPPDLIVCDIHLPGMDGYEVARQLKAHPAHRNIPLIAVTALAMVGDREKVLASGFDGYIAKPIVPETFVSQVEVFLKKSLHAAPRVEMEFPAEPPAAEADGSKHAVLLVVDDSDVELGLMHSVFDPSGYEVIQAADLAQALELARRLTPDLLVSDVNMPGGSGLELLAAIKAEPQLRHIPVILITSTALNETDRQRGLECGATRYIMRPIEPQALLSQVEACLRSIKKQTLGDILLVDDIAANSDVVQSILEPSGYTVRVAFSADEAFKLASQRTPDLMLTDMHMPAAGGLSLARAFRSDPSLRSVQIAVSSASFASAQEYAEAQALGVSAYISRPIEAAKLLAEVSALLKSAKES